MIQPFDLPEPKHIVSQVKQKKQTKWVLLSGCDEQTNLSRPTLAKSQSIRFTRGVHCKRYHPVDAHDIGHRVHQVDFLSPQRHAFEWGEDAAQQHKHNDEKEPRKVASQNTFCHQNLSTVKTLRITSQFLRKLVTKTNSFLNYKMWFAEGLRVTYIYLLQNSTV